MSKTFTEMKAGSSQSEIHKYSLEKAPMSDSSYSNIPAPTHIENVAPTESLESENQIDSLLWSRIRREFRDPFAEFFGVFIMILFGDGTDLNLNLYYIVCC